MKSSNPFVQKQYNEWPFPEPISDLEAWSAHEGYQQYDIAQDHDIFWPERPYKEDISILVAGCGTMEAALAAYNNPRASIIGIDISSTSLEYAAKLKQKHDLLNLELMQMDLHEISSLNRKFDLIISFGVLHHLPNPVTGLISLSDVLHDDGVILLSLYSKYPRTGVYMIQDALRRIGIDQTPRDAAFTRNLICSLPPTHPVRINIKPEDMINVSDSDIVDTFLHKQDRPFSVPEILDLTEDSSLNFQGWLDNLDYYPDGIFYDNPSIYQKITGLPEREQWAVIELLAPYIGRHRFLLRKKNCDKKKVQINLKDESLFELVPSYRRGLSAKKKEGGSIELSREWHRCSIRALYLDLFLAINSTSTIGEIVENFAKNSPERSCEVFEFFRHFWRLGHLTFARQV